VSGGSSDGVWHFPASAHQPGEEIRKAAEVALAEVLTDDQDRQVYFIGHSPAGHANYPGATVFFHRAQLIKGMVALRPNTRCYDYVWVTKEELPQYIEDEELQKLFEMMLPGP
jgi:large subunit ribosomal protein L46